MYPSGYLKQLADCCKENEVLLIVDEIAMGFGRTGKRFAHNHADIDPDLVCIGKALTGGYMPLSACIVKDVLYDTFSNLGEKIVPSTTAIPTPDTPSAAPLPSPPSVSTKPKTPLPIPPKKPPPCVSK